MDRGSAPMRARAAGVAAALVAVLLPGAVPAEAQVIEGRVLDSLTAEPVAVARVSLLDEDGDRVHTTLSADDGTFTLRARREGLHRLEVDRLGYGDAQRTAPFEVDGEGVTRREVRLLPDAVQVDGIVARAHPGGLLHEATLAGVYARRARSLDVGSNRVLVRGDPELDHQFRVRDVLPAWIPRPFCPREDVTGGGRRLEPRPFVYYDGRPADHVMGLNGERFILDLPVTEVEAVEFYRDWQSAPMAARPETGGRTSVETGRRDVVRACGIVLVWSRGAPR